MKASTGERREDNCDHGLFVQKVAEAMVPVASGPGKLLLLLLFSH